MLICRLRSKSLANIAFLLKIQFIAIIKLSSCNNQKMYFSLVLENMTELMKSLSIKHKQKSLYSYCIVIDEGGVEEEVVML